MCRSQYCALSIIIYFLTSFYSIALIAETFEHNATYTSGVSRYFKDVALGDVDNDGDLDIWGVKLQELEALADIGDAIFINQFAKRVT